MHIKDFLIINTYRIIRFKKIFFGVTLIIFSSISYVEYSFAKANVSCQSCSHSNVKNNHKCETCGHDSQYEYEEELYNTTRPFEKEKPKKGSEYHIILDGISFEDKSNEDTDESDNEENYDSGGSEADINPENTSDDLEDPIEEETSPDDVDDFSESKFEENDTENSDEETLDEQIQQEKQDMEEPDILDSPSENSDSSIQSADNSIMPNNVMDTASLQSADNLSMDSSGNVSAAGADNYQEIVQDVIEYFREMGVLDENKLSQLSRGLKNGVCMVCNTNGLIHVIPGRKLYNICSNCFERMVETFVTTGSGRTILNSSVNTALGGNAIGNGSYNNGGNSYLNGQAVNNANGQNSPDATSGIVGAALSSIPGMNGQLESALSSGISSILHKDSTDSGLNAASGSAMQNTNTLGSSGLPIASTPLNQVPVGTTTTATTTGNQMVLNALGQLVPMSSLAGTAAPYGYIKNPDGTFSPATSSAQGLAAANSTTAGKINNTINKVNNTISTVNTIANAAAPAAGLLSSLASAASNLKTQKTATANSNSQTQQANSSKKSTDPEKKHLKQRKTTSSNSGNSASTTTTSKKMKNRS